MQFMSGSGYRAAVCIALSYWRAECPDITLDDASLAALAHMNASQWTHVKAVTIPAIATLLPALRTQYERATAANARRVNAGRKRWQLGAGRLTVERKAALAEMAEKSLLDTVSPATLHSTPSHAKPYSNPRSATTPQELATIGQQTATALQQSASTTQTATGKPARTLARLYDES